MSALPLLWQCKQCKAGFYTKNLLGLHMSAFHKEGPVTNIGLLNEVMIMSHGSNHFEGLPPEVKKRIIKAENEIDFLMKPEKRKSLEKKFKNLKVLTKLHKVTELGQICTEDIKTETLPHEEESYGDDDGEVMKDDVKENDGANGEREPLEEDQDLIVVVNDEGIYVMDKDNLKQEIKIDTEEPAMSDDNRCDMEFGSGQGTKQVSLVSHLMETPGVLEMKSIRKMEIDGLRVQSVKTVLDFKCLRCDKVFPTRHERRLHLETHAKDLRFFCSECGRGFRKRQGLLLHLNVHTEGSRHQCPHCNNFYRSDRYLKEHIKLHIPEEYKFQCSVCAKMFAHSTALKYHMHAHNNYTPYKCHLCGKEYRQKPSLEAHLNLHEGARPYQCAVCGKGFRMKNTLREHQRLHTQERPYACKYPGCDKKYTLKNQLKNHTRRHTEDKQHACTVPDCDKRFFYMSHLQRHLRTTHRASAFRSTDTHDVDYY